MGTILSLIGITLDIIGVILLFMYGFNSDFFKVFLQEPSMKTDKNIKSWMPTIKKSNAGFLLLIFGFAFQFLGTIWPVIEPHKPEIKCKCKGEYYQRYPPVAYINYEY